MGCFSCNPECMRPLSLSLPPSLSFFFFSFLSVCVRLLCWRSGTTLLAQRIVKPSAPCSSLIASHFLCEALALPSTPRRAVSIGVAHATTRNPSHWRYGRPGEEKMAFPESSHGPSSRTCSVYTRRSSPNNPAESSAMLP